MTFTKEQMERLAPYEKFFQTAVLQAWCRYPGLAGMKEIHGIYTEATGDRRKLNADCGTCILNLVRDCGTLYFRDRKEMRETAGKATNSPASERTGEIRPSARSAEKRPVTGGKSKKEK